MKEDQRISDYNQGFTQGQLHSKASPETVELITKTNEKVCEIYNILERQQKLFFLVVSGGLILFASLIGCLLIIIT